MQQHTSVSCYEDPLRSSPEILIEDSQPMNFQSLLKDKGTIVRIKGDQFLIKVNDLNEAAIIKHRQGKVKEAMVLLQKAEKILEFTASCGKAIDRNLIIVVLFNEACGYQRQQTTISSQWILDKCSKYIDGVIYNLTLSIKEEQAEILQSMSTESSTRDIQSLTVKRQSFLVRAYLQYCAILSQLGMQLQNYIRRHKAALENAKKAASTMRELFKTAFDFCKEQRRSIYLTGSANSTQTTFNSNKQTRALSVGRNYSKHEVKQDESMTLEGKKFITKDEVAFSKLVVDQAYNALQDLSQQEDIEDMNIAIKFNEAKRQLFYWRNNPENNEKQIRKELNMPIAAKDDDFRGLLGIQNVQEWIENFNIGSIMHMEPLSYEDFQSYGEMIYEISKRVLLEKIIYLSITYFTIATEIRFLEIEKAKAQGVNESNIQTNEFRMSEVYHLRAIEIACKYVVCYSPYINHLITSYHKHYKQNLDTIVIDIIKLEPEESFCSQLEQSLEQKKTKVLDRKTDKISPTARILTSFVNQNTTTNVTPRAKKPDLKNKFPSNPSTLASLLATSPNKAVTRGILSKRDSSPTIAMAQNISARTQTVPSITFFQNAIQAKHGNQSLDNNSNTNASAKISNSVMQEPQSNTSFSMQPQPKTSSNSKTTKTQLSSLLGSSQVRPRGSHANIFQQPKSQGGQFSYRQALTDKYSSLRPNESLSPKQINQPIRDELKGKIVNREKKVPTSQVNLRLQSAIYQSFINKSMVGSCQNARECQIRLENLQQFQMLLRKQKKN